MSNLPGVSTAKLPGLWMLVCAHSKRWGTTAVNSVFSLSLVSDGSHAVVAVILSLFAVTFGANSAARS
jgi:hypothetical protein